MLRNGLKVVFAIGLLTAAIMSSDTAKASVRDRIKLGIKRIVLSETVSMTAGQQKFLVASNTPFKISATGSVGNIKVKLKSSGNVDGQPFGRASQIPGDRSVCKLKMMPGTSVVYESERKTAIRPGSELQQAVLVIIDYEAEFEPDFNFYPAPKIAAGQLPYAMRTPDACDHL